MRARLLVLDGAAALHFHRTVRYSLLNATPLRLRAERGGV